MDILWVKGTGNQHDGDSSLAVGLQDLHWFILEGFCQLVR